MPREGAPIILRMVVRARRDAAIQPWGVFDMSKEKLPWPMWESSLGWAEEGSNDITVRNPRQSARRFMPATTKWTPLGARATPCM